MESNVRKMLSKGASVILMMFAPFAHSQTEVASELKSSDDRQIVESSLRSMPKGYRLGPTDAVAVVLVSQQRMIVKVLDKILSYPVSTAQAGVGAEARSGKTPPGWHRVKKRIGSNVQTGQLFISRRVIKGVVRNEKERHNGSGDEVLSRIFWLEGLEPKLNRDPKGNYDSYLRHIYIHGTNQEALLGTPVSHGCIRMGNQNIVNLFDQVKPCRNFYVLISCK